MNLAGIIPNDTAAAPGICVSVFISGCPLHCPGCHNQEMQNPYYGKPFTNETKEHILDLLHANGIKRTLCIMGGEPLAPYNAQGVSDLVDFIRKRSPETKIYIWTGYTLEELLAPDERYTDFDYSTILRKVDYLIDGPFELDKRDITLPMRGSSNQRIINLKERLKGRFNL